MNYHYGMELLEGIYELALQVPEDTPDELAYNNVYKFLRSLGAVLRFVAKEKAERLAAFKAGRSSDAPQQAKPQKHKRPVYPASGGLRHPQRIP